MRSELRLKIRQDFNGISLFRYGLPVNFQAIVIHPHKKSQKRLKDVLQQLYGHLDGSGGAGSNTADVRTMRVLMGKMRDD